MNKESIKCPECNSKDMYIGERMFPGLGWKWGVVCLNCTASTNGYDTEEDALFAWHSKQLSQVFQEVL